MLRPSFALGAAACLACALAARSQPAPAAPRTPTIEEKTAGLQKLDGFFPLYWDQQAGELWLEIPRFDSEFLYVTGLAAGLGSNDLGLDRGAPGGEHLVFFERVGPKALLVEPNETFRSSSANAAERRSVDDSFARSVLWGFTVAAESGGRVLVDATDFFVRDGLGAAASLRPGAYKVDKTRSAIYPARTKAFPLNSEIEATLTFAKEGSSGGPAGGDDGDGMFSGSLASVTPSPEAVTLREHYSLVQLPDGNFQPRAFDPRAGYFDLSYADYSAPIGDAMVRRFIERHRLEKKDPNAAVSDAVKPIQYWVDPGAPEDVRRALIEGASWWNQAFEAAGYRNAFQVAVLPEGADPMDIRYNMINWVHRSTRGWSYGASITDPRTGEIIKASVLLGSLRDRQDYMIFEGLTSPYASGDEKPDALYQAALARIRQLAAHEVGHTLGLAHNYYDSSKGWISVMDYPHPVEKLNDDGSIDLSNAYPVGIGEWDKVAIRYGYGQFEAGGEAAGLKKVLDDAWAQDLRFLTNQDLGAHPRVDQWSNGVDQAEELNRIMKVRRAALNRLGERTIRNGAPMATIEEALAPIFMYHRYAVEAASHMLGGLDYIYAMRGDGRTPLKWEGAAEQRKALAALTATLKPSELALSRQILDAIPPRPPGYERTRELFPRNTGQAFDPVSPAAVAADVTVGFVLQADRAARLVDQHAEDSSLPGLEEVIGGLVKATFDAPAATGYEAEIRRAEERVVVDRLMALAGSAPNQQVRAATAYQLNRLAARLKAEPGVGDGEQAQRAQLASEIKRFQDRPAEAVHPAAQPQIPPGAPIGDPEPDWLARPR
ncbi:MAG TPA: zinc-dependent metalloprotease [Bryobacteraceae bacterium]|nr:zinc-dependent metalloprotease [Bryobacteraceae bacterium]